MLSKALLTPICVVTDYQPDADGSMMPIYSIGGDGVVTQTLYSGQYVSVTEGNDTADSE